MQIRWVNNVPPKELWRGAKRAVPVVLYADAANDFEEIRTLLARAQIEFGDNHRIQEAYEVCNRWLGNEWQEGLTHLHRMYGISYCGAEADEDSENMTNKAQEVTCGECMRIKQQ